MRAIPSSATGHHILPINSVIPFIYVSTYLCQQENNILHSVDCIERRRAWIGMLGLSSVLWDSPESRGLLGLLDLLDPFTCICADEDARSFITHREMNLLINLLISTSNCLDVFCSLPMTKNLHETHTYMKKESEKECICMRDYTFGSLGWWVDVWVTAEALPHKGD